MQIGKIVIACRSLGLCYVLREVIKQLKGGMVWTQMAPSVGNVCRT